VANITTQKKGVSQGGKKSCWGAFGAFERISGRGPWFAGRERRVTETKQERGEGGTKGRWHLGLNKKAKKA